MKYITTEKHPWLKKGTEISLFIDGPMNEGSYFLNRKEYYSPFTPKQEIKKAWIKEVEEKEFTDSDVLDFIDFLNFDMSYLSYKEILKSWKRQRS